jgi:hypothetical protein
VNDLIKKVLLSGEARPSGISPRQLHGASISSSKTPPASAEPNTEEASRFIRALICNDQAGDQYTSQTFDDSESKRSHLAKIFHGRGNAEALKRLNAAGAGVFLTINATDGKGRTNANIRCVRALFVDADKDGAAVLAKIKAAGPAPHIVVESSPGKFHAYWLVNRDFPLDQFTSAQAALARKFGTDEKVKDLARVMRLPGFYHMKDPARPFMVRIVELNDE